MAGMTGGRAFLNPPDIAGSIRQIFDETGSYYLLGYRSTRAARDRRTRKVEVRAL